MIAYRRLFTFVATLLACHWVQATPYSYRSCKNIAGDPARPGPEDWARLNETVDGRLIATAPVVMVYHNPSYHYE